jgi:hypothetical protein
VSACPRGTTRFPMDGLTLNLLKTTIVAPLSNASKWQMGFNSAFRGLRKEVVFRFFLRKSIEKIHVWLNLTKITDSYHDDLCVFMIIFLWILRMGFLDTNFRENQNTPSMFSTSTALPARKYCRVWDNVGKCCKYKRATDDDNIRLIRRLRSACWNLRLQTHTQNM